MEEKVYVIVRYSKRRISCMYGDSGDYYSEEIDVRQVVKSESKAQTIVEQLNNQRDTDEWYEYWVFDLE